MENKLRIVFIAPGPIYKPESSAYQNRFNLLSSKMSGYILTTSDESIKLDIGRFKFFAVRRGVGKIASYLNLLCHCIRFALSVRKKRSIDCIVTYDPLKTGLIGCLVKYIIGVKLIVEVNGVYTSPAVWMDEPSTFAVRVKKKIIPVVMSFVFKCADGIKLQFPGQIKQFADIVVKKDVRTFPNLTPVERFCNLGEKKEILLVGFPFKLKGVDILIEAFKKISHRFPDWKLKILGWYPVLFELKQAIAEHPNISHHPPVQYDEMPIHIGYTGIVAQPSRTDALPRILIEAAAAGKARIGSCVDGIPLAIEDGVDGFLIESENVKELAEKLSILIESKELRYKFGEAAANKAKTIFGANCYYNNTYEFYTQVVSR